VLSHAYLAPQRRSAFARNLFARFARMASALRGTFTSRLLAAPVPRWLGYVSFSLYLIHFPVQCLFHAVQPQAGLSYQSPLVFAAFMISSLAAASLVARGFEWPVYRLLTGRQLK